tara:strand:- start:2604 stop:3131 length:528 start_codon:yes stop_codon:yes gene_type:complete
MILGLDISTSITGYTVLDDNGNIVVCDHIDLRKQKDFFQKATTVEAVLVDIKKQHSIKNVYIELPFMFFKSGGSSAITMSVLQRFNGVISWMCYNLFKVTPEYFGATEARKLCGIKVPRGQKAKDVVMKFVLDTEAEFSVEYTRNNNPKAGYADRADSYVIAKAGSTTCKKKNLS